MTRYAGVLSALLLTALLFYLMPGLVTTRLSDTGRTDESLKPPVARTLTVWVTSWQPEDRTLLGGLCSAFEKQQPGLRIYLRRVDVDELYAQDAVLPDVVLHAPGDILSPGDALLPLASPNGYPEGAAWTGAWQGEGYALPLWYSPNVLCLPGEWAIQERDTADGEAGNSDASAMMPQQTEPSYFALQTPVPGGDAAMQPITLDTLPWDRLQAAGTLYADSPIGLPQLMLLCPNTLRQELSGLTIQLTDAPPADAAAIRSLYRHLKAADGRIALAMPTVASQRVRYASLCRASQDGEAFIRFLTGETAAAQAVAAGLAPVCPYGAEASAEPLLRQTLELAQTGLMLPNAFCMGTAELEALCLQDFASAADPVATLLKLR